MARVLDTFLVISSLFGLSSAFHLSGGLSSCADPIPEGLKHGPDIDVFIFTIGSGHWDNTADKDLKVGEPLYSLEGHSQRYSDENFVNNSNVHNNGGRKVIHKREKRGGKMVDVEYYVNEKGEEILRKDVDREMFHERSPRDQASGCQLMNYGSFQERYKRDALAVINTKGDLTYIYDLYRKADHVLQKGDQVVVFGTGNAEWDRCGYNYLRSQHGEPVQGELKTWQTKNLDFLSGFTFGREARNEHWNSFLNFGGSFKNIPAIGERKGMAEHFRPYLGSKSPQLTTDSNLLFVRGVEGYDNYKVDSNQDEDFRVLTTQEKCKQRVLNNGGNWLGEQKDEFKPEPKDDGKKDDGKKDDGKKDDGKKDSGKKDVTK